MFYNFICRFVKRNEKDVQTVLFTVNEENQEIDVTEMELFLEDLGESNLYVLAQVGCIDEIFQ